jgi:hypothetical protein
MSMLEFFSEIAWPLVGLIAILILGPGGVLKSSIVGLADKLTSISSSVSEFRTLTEDFNARQRVFSESMQWLRNSDNELSRISSVLDAVRQNTSEMLLTQGEQQISEIAGDELVGDETDQVVALTSQQMFDQMYQRWGELTELVRQRIGVDNFDGRAIGLMAWRLAHRKRANPISKDDAELIGTLHSQFKRFARMHATKDDWLSEELFRNFTNGVEKAMQGLT